MSRSLAEPDTVIALERFLPYRLSVLSNTVSSAIARLYAERFGLTIPEWRIMCVLADEAPLPANRVGDRTRMDKVTVSRAVTRLLAADRIERDTDSTDRRRSALRLSDAGWRLYREIAPLAQRVEDRLLAGLAADEVATLDRLLSRLQNRANGIDEAMRAASDPVK